MRLLKSKAVVFTYTGSSFVPIFSVSAGKTIKLLWGDGQATIINGPVTGVAYTHNYAASGTYQFRIVGDLDGITRFQYNNAALSGDISTLRVLTSLTSLQLGNTSVSGDISNLSGLTSLTILHLYNTSVSGNIADLSGLTALINLQLYSGSISGDILSISGLPLLTRLYLQNTSVSGDIADLSGLTALINLKLYNTSINTYTQGVLPDWDNCDIYINDLGLSQQEVDDFLCDLNTASSASVKVLEIQGTNAVPSATGLACVNDDPDGLRAKGWTVTLST